MSKASLFSDQAPVLLAPSARALTLSCSGHLALLTSYDRPIKPPKTRKLKPILRRMGCSFVRNHLHLVPAYTKGYQYPSVRRYADQSETPEVVQLPRAAEAMRRWVHVALGEKRANQP
jgi:hypothetical protein